MGVLAADWPSEGFGLELACGVFAVKRVASATLRGLPLPPIVRGSIWLRVDWLGEGYKWRILRCVECGIYLHIGRSGDDEALHNFWSSSSQAQGELQGEWADWGADSEVDTGR